MHSYILSPLQTHDLAELKKFCDHEIGNNYFRKDELQMTLDFSQKNNLTSSFVARDQNHEIVAVRLTYAPGNWTIDPKKFSLDLWKVDQTSVAYFKSMFIRKDFQGSGLGGKISKSALEILKKQGAKAVVCHCTLGSPFNASKRYLEKLGFNPLRTYPNFWAEIDYDCAHCRKKPCICTALEMVLYLE